MGACILLENNRIARDTYKMTLSCDFAKKCMPGQFIHLMIPDFHSHILRRPFSLNSVNIENETIDIVYKPVGEGTTAMTTLQVGRHVDVLGPLGNGFDMPDSTQKAWLVGGGLGIAPLLFIPQYYPHVQCESFLGFCEKESVYGISEFEKACNNVFTSTDDGSFCRLGYVTEMVEEALRVSQPDIIFTCGPVPMLKSLKKVLAPTRIPCQVALEERMGCGVGACLTCNCKVNEGDGWHYARVCKDGPVFQLSEVEL